jgi:hypothetical protein
MIIVMGGCSSQKLQLSGGDVNALKQIRVNSPWQFQQSSVDIQVHQPNAIEINIKGEAVHRENQQGGPMWLPVALFRDLPEYLKGATVNSQNSQTPVELQAYKVAGGLWCVVAVVPLDQPLQQSTANTPTDVPSPSATPAAPKFEPVNLQVLFVSPEFETSLPLLIPISQQGVGVDLSISLPQGTRFTSQNLSSSKISDQITTLTVLPPSTTGGAIRAAAKLIADKDEAWNLTEVTYQSTKVWERLLQQMLLASALMTLILAGFYWMNSPVLRYRKEISSLPFRIRKEIAQLYSEVSEKGLLNPSLALEAEFLHNNEIGELIEYLFDVRRRIRKLIRKFEPDLYDSARLIVAHGFEEGRSLKKSRDEKLESLKGAVKDYSELVDKCESILSYSSNSTLTLSSNSWLQKQREFINYTILFIHRVEYIDQLSKGFSYKSTFRERYIAVFTLLTLMLLAMYALVVRGQSPTQAAQNPQSEKVSVLGDFDMSIAPIDSNSMNVGVSLGFIALSDKNTPDKKEVGVGTGNNNDAEIEVTKVSDGVDIVHQSKKEVRFSVPVSNIPSLNVLGTLSSPEFQVEQIRITDSLQAALSSEGNFVRLEYTVKRAQDTKNYFGTWLHRFPFDSKSVVIPLKLEQSAIVSKVELPRQADFTGVPSARGIDDVSFLEKENIYYLDLGRRDRRVMFPAAKEVVFEVTFRRTRWQQIFLTVGQLVLAIIAGISFGYMITLKSHSALATTIESLGLIGLVYLIRTNVSSTYKDLPNLFSGQTPTLFDLFFLLSLILFVGVTYVTWRRRRATKR